MKILFPVIALHRDGKTVVLDNLDLLRDFVRGKSVGPEWNYTWAYDYNYRVMRYVYGEYGPQNDWILRDDAGRPVDPPAPICVKGGWWQRRMNEVAQAAAKGLPIPRTGYRRGRRRKRGGGCGCDWCMLTTKKRQLNALNNAEVNAAENDYDGLN